MITKYDIGEKVLIEGTVTSIRIDKQDRIYYCIECDDHSPTRSGSVEIIRKESCVHEAD